MEPAHRTTLLIDLTVGERLQILCEKGRVCVQKWHCDTKPAISLKCSSLEPELLQSLYVNSCIYDLSIGDKSGDLT